MNPAGTPPALPHEALEAAAHWYVQLHDAAPEDRQHAAWERWLAADVRHRQAWERMQALAERLGALPPELAGPTLAKVRSRRRRAVKTLALLLSAGTLGALLPRLESGWELARADHRTRSGERRRIALADGGVLDLNSASAIRIEYGPALRRLRLLSGEILIRTAPDPALRRPFEVHTEHGAVRALGTRFSVRHEDGQTRVAVLEHAVEIRPQDGPAARIEAGQQSVFSTRAASAPVPLQPGEGAWSEGKLIAIDRRLDDFLAELARHRPGHIACAPEVAGLRLSGTFRLHDTDAVLDNLAASLPIRLRYLTRYWVRVEAG
ncbi:DUF4880 domain-containing protein [Pseudothauera nasutitermitis]|uniref:DUF4880 domain-containing protein n=1 Tax=Pseudothauera nasutitermitis TaxID=2565930 RepID=A0A4V3WBF8_9RHOO|nr:FecR domain-containing protein [Pseudothauera nasutitermitis]THF63049.1 DUF4880 domain-containing protein [Pseudothauera nasutitermitis]